MIPIWRRAVWIALALLSFYALLVVLVWSQQTRLLYPAPQEAVPLSPGFEETELRTADGLRLRAFYLQAQPGKRTVVYFHGNGGSLLGATLETEALADAGLGLLLVAYRGYGGNPGAPSESGLYADGRAAMAFLADREIPARETVLVGNSMGSGVATQIATEFAPAGLVLSAGYTSLPDVAASKMPWLPVRHLMRDHYDNASKLRDLDIPVLVLHGRADTLIPHTHGETLANAAPDGQLVLFEGVGHDLSFHPEPQAAMASWIAALE